MVGTCSLATRIKITEPDTFFTDFIVVGGLW